MAKKKRTRAGSISIFRRHDRGGGYYTFVGGRRRSLGTSEYREAVKKAAELHAEQPRRTDRPTVTWLCRKFREEQEARSPGHRRLVEQLLKALEPRLGRKRLVDVRSRDLAPIPKLAASERAGPVRRNRIRAVLRRLFQLAVELDLLETNPVRFPPERARSRPRPAFTVEQLKALLRLAKEGDGEWRPPDYLHALILLAATTGMRRGEILRLRGRDLDREGCRLRVYRPKVGNETVFELEPDVVDVLPCCGPDDLLFPADPKATFTTLIKRAGLAGKRLSFHSLRHTWTTLAARAGKPSALLRDILGHTSLNTTERYLARLDEAVPVGKEVLEAVGGVG